jgi:hypothetical protein
MQCVIHDRIKALSLNGIKLNASLYYGRRDFLIFCSNKYNTGCISRVQTH